LALIINGCPVIVKLVKVIAAIETPLYLSVTTQPVTTTAVWAVGFSVKVRTSGPPAPDLASKVGVWVFVHVRYAGQPEVVETTAEPETVYKAKPASVLVTVSTYVAEAWPIAAVMVVLAVVADSGEVTTKVAIAVPVVVPDKSDPSVIVTVAW
jgi:hypothetical protein